jgi:hypothetical protein
MKALLIGWLALVATPLLWQPRRVVFEARWLAMPPAMNWEMLDRARKASARPSFCQWDYPGTACRIS